jgi:hypothetical protein
VTLYSDNDSSVQTVLLCDDLPSSRLARRQPRPEVQKRVGPNRYHDVSQVAAFDTWQHFGMLRQCYGPRWFREAAERMQILQVDRRGVCSIISVESPVCVHEPRIAGIRPRTPLCIGHRSFLSKPFQGART